MTTAMSLATARVVCLGGLACALACAGADDPSAPDEFPVSFVVTNKLVAPVTIAIDGMPYLGLKAGSSSSLTVPSTAQWLTWNSAKPMDGASQPIPDDIGDVTVAIGGINRALEISNVIADQTYITVEFFNTTGASVSIGVYDGISVSCAGRLPAASNVSGYTRIGYYRLKPETEIRAYRDGGCGGAYVAWTPEQLQRYTSKSGLLALTLETPP